MPPSHLCDKNTSKGRFPTESSSSFSASSLSTRLISEIGGRFSLFESRLRSSSATTTCGVPGGSSRRFSIEGGLVVASAVAHSTARVVMSAPSHGLFLHSTSQQRVPKA